MDDADLFQPIDLTALIAIVRRYSKRIALGSLIACAGLFGTLEALPNRYTAEAIISGGGSPASLQDFDGIRIENRIDLGIGTESEASILRSDAFLARLATAVGLPRLLREANQRSGATWVEQIQAAVQHVLSMLRKERPASTDPEEIRAFKILKANLDVRGDEKVPLLKIRYTDEDPVLAADVVNAAAKLLLDSRHAMLEQRLEKSIGALREQIDKVRAQVSIATERAARLRSDLQYFSTPSGSILAQQITDATRALSEATVGVSVANARYNAALASAGHDRSNRAINELLDSRTLQRLVMEETTLRGKDAELASTFGKHYPQRAEIKSRLADVGNAIQKEISHLLAALQQKVIEAQKRQAALRERLDDLRSRTAEAGKVDLAIQTSERQLDGLLHSQNGLVRLLQQLQFGTTDTGRLHIASLGVPPLVPSQPHRFIVFLIGSVIILGIAFTLAVAHAVGTRKCLTLHGVRAIDVAREVFSIPWIQRGRRRQLLGNPANAGQRLDRYLMRRVRDITLWMATEKGSRPLAVAVTSVDPGEGKTTISMLLAYGFASMGRRTIVLDCDPCSKEATKRLAAISATDKTPYYATASKKMCASTFSGDTSALRDCLKGLHADFDVVVIDTPPLGPVTEAINIMPLSTYRLLVTDWRSARFDRLARVRALFERYHLAIDLIVFNRLPEGRRARRALRRSGYALEGRILEVTQSRSTAAGSQ